MFTFLHSKRFLGNNIIESKVGDDIVKAKPDDRSDNVERIQENINNTMKNINLANEVIATSNNPEEIATMKDRNEKRRESLEKMKSEIREEAMHNRMQ